MNATTAISEPQRGHDNGSTSYTRLISMAQVLLQRVGAAAEASSPRGGLAPFPACCAAVSLRMPRVLFE